MSDHFCVTAKMKCHASIEYTKCFTNKNVKQIMNLPTSIEYIVNSQNWGEIGARVSDRITKTILYQGPSERDRSICHKLLTGKLPTLTLQDKILRYIIDTPNIIPKGAWNILKQYEGSLSKKPSFFLQGISTDLGFTMDKQFIYKAVTDHYTNKFNEIEINEIKSTELIQKHKSELPKTGQILKFNAVYLAINDFYKRTAFGPDWIPIELLKFKLLRIIMALKICTIINRERTIPADMLTGRMLLFTKTGSPIADIRKTRPIMVQTVALRIIEKLIRNKLQSCDACNNFWIDSYQTGFTAGMTTLINQVRIKQIIGISKRQKRYPQKRPYIFLLDICGAFD